MILALGRLRWRIVSLRQAQATWQVLGDSVSKSIFSMRDSKIHLKDKKYKSSQDFLKRKKQGQEMQLSHRVCT
jgi:hypothetical protein